MVDENVFPANPEEAEVYAAEIQAKVKLERERLAKLNKVVPDDIVKMIGEGGTKDRAHKISQFYKDYNANQEELEEKVALYVALEKTHKSDFKTRIAALLEGNFKVAIGGNEGLKSYKQNKINTALNELATVVNEKVIQAKVELRNRSVGGDEIQLPKEVLTDLHRSGVVADSFTFGDNAPISSQRKRKSTKEKISR